MIKNYINLTNGIECINIYKLKEYSFIRIQSTACEQKRWEFILQDLDNDFLMNLALGNECVIYDCSCRGTSRAIWQGLEWIKYILNRVWFNEIINTSVRGNNCSIYFEECYQLLNRKTLKKLKYYKKFLNTKKLNLYHICLKTNCDGNYGYYLRLLKKL
jgi:hypothetical protein